MIKKEMIMISMLLCLLGVSGCSHSSPSVIDNQEPIALQEEDIDIDSKAIAEQYREIYEQEAQNGTIGRDAIRKIVQCLGENGYVAVDYDNQVDMVNPDKVKEFAQKAERQEEAEPASILNEEEELQLQDDAILAAQQCMDLYKDVEIVEAGPDYSYIEIFSQEQRQAVVERLGEYGVVSVSDNMNMKNYEKVEAFYADYLSGKDALVTVFTVWQDGAITALTFIHRDGKIQSYYVGIGWKEGGVPEISGAGIDDLEEIKLTEKGYFIYTNTVPIAHGNLREYYRVKPLSDKCRELTEKYISGLSYVNYNLLVTNWDSGNAEEILMPCMFEDIYRIYQVCTGESLKTENGNIPAEVYEHVMTTYFPVSAEQVRNHCGYDAGSNSYGYEMIFPRQFPPFGEVVDYTKNGDGTLTLYVDGVWPDYNSDLAFTNRIVVQPFENGTFRYLSNSIEKRELDIPVVE